MRIVAALASTLSLAVALGGLLANPAGAATMTLQPSGNGVVLEGQIVRGDLEKLQQVAKQGSPTLLYLASGGGDLVEAMRIGFFVRARAWETRSAEPMSLAGELRAGAAAAMGVRDPVHNNQCTSACFLIFVAGIYRDGHRLGVHTPQIAPGDLQRMPPDKAAQETDNIKVTVARYLWRMSVPYKYLEAMYSVPYDKIRWLTDEEILADLHGFVPEVREWVATQCPGEDLQSTSCRDKVMLGIRLRALEAGPGN